MRSKFKSRIETEYDRKDPSSSRRFEAKIGGS